MFDEIIQNKKIVLLGASTEAEIVYKKIGSAAQMVAVLDEDAESKNEFYEYKVKSIECLSNFIDNNKYLIIVTYSRYELYKELLTNCHMQILKNWIPWTFIYDNLIDMRLLYFMDSDQLISVIHKDAQGRKLCGLYGECHMRGFYLHALMRNREFTNNYFTLVFPWVDWNEYIEGYDFFMKRLDLFISNMYSAKNIRGVVSTEEMQSKTNSSCRNITITNAFFSGYFPQYSKPFDETIYWFTCGDKNINRMIREYKNEQDIIESIMSENFYSTDFVNEYWDFSIKKIKAIENKCDITISDFIEKYGQDEELYYMNNHPKNIVMKEIFRRVCTLIGIKCETSNFYNIEPMRHIHQPVYKSVIKGLGITKDSNENRLYFPAEGIRQPVKEAEYYKLYIRLNQPIILAKSINDGTDI